jgi:hypothetical protein
VKNRRSALFLPISCFRVGGGSKSAKKNVSSGSGFTQKMSQRVKGKTGKMVEDSGENSGKRAVLAALERKIRRSERLFLTQILPCEMA